MKVIALIPAYDPGEIIIDVVKATRDQVDQVILVNDGSDEKNTTILRSLNDQFENIVLVEHAINHGKGHAIMTGFSTAMQLECDAIVMLDSDGQHDPLEISQFIGYARKNNSHFIMGVRSEISKMPLRSKFGNMSMSAVFRVFYGQSIRDTQSGFRFLSAAFAKQILKNVKAGRYETEMKMLTFAAKNNIRIDQVPIKTIYIDENRNSKFRPVNDSLRVLGSLFAYAGVGFASFLLDYGVYLLITYILSGSFLTAHAVSRSISGIFNYYANKRYVFNHSGKFAGTVGKYLLAVVFSLFLSASILYFLVDYAHINRALAKPIAEFSTFFINFFVLGRFVFRQ